MPAIASASGTAYRFRRALPEDLYDIQRLNHETFAGELQQHEETATGLLADPFDHKNTYFVAVSGAGIAGMVAVHDEAPFSVAAKLADARVLDDLGSKLLEVRLLAIAPSERKTTVFAGLLYAVLQYARRHGHSHL